MNSMQTVPEVDLGRVATPDQGRVAARVNRYDQVAGYIRELILGGTYAPGQKLPSVRGLRSQLGVSITTVLEAYRVLEDEGLAEARPQSGYYVQSGAGVVGKREAGATESFDPVGVSMGDFLSRHLRDFRRSDLVPFGDACPNPEHLPTERLARAIAKVSKDAGRWGNSYDVPPGCDTLRVQIARRALQAGLVARPEEVMLTIGCQEAISLCLRATCEPGDTVAVGSPTFYGHLQAIEMLGLKVVEIPCDPIHGLSFAALSQALADNPIRAMVLCTNFSNPTGITLSIEDKQQLLQLLARNEVPLIEDDTFGDLYHSGPHRPQVARAFDSHDRVLLCSSFSKTMAPGYRVGWVIAGPRYMPRLLHLKLFSNLASPALPALAVSEFLQNGGFDHHLRQSRKLLATQVREMADCVLASFPAGTRVTRPQGGFVLWVELPDSYDTRHYYAGAIELGVTFGPGPIFSARGRFRNCLRLCAPYWSEATEPRVAALGELFCRGRESH